MSRLESEIFLKISFDRFRIFSKNQAHPPSRSNCTIDPKKSNFKNRKIQIIRFKSIFCDFLTGDAPTLRILDPSAKLLGQMYP